MEQVESRSTSAIEISTKEIQPQKFMDCIPNTEIGSTGIDSIGISSTGIKSTGIGSTGIRSIRLLMILSRAALCQSRCVVFFNFTMCSNISIYKSR